MKGQSEHGRSIAVRGSNRRVLLYLFRPGLYGTLVLTVVLIILNAAIPIASAYYLLEIFVGEAFPAMMLFLALVSACGAGIGIWSLASLPQRASVSVQGLSVSPEEQPGLWAHVRRLAEQAGAGAPDHIVIGLEPHFFVSELDAHCIGGELKGRTVFVSLPLTRMLTLDEWSAVIGHELGHFKALDARFSDKYQSLYGALGGAVFVLIGAYFACVVFYLWAQCLFAVTRVDVEALEKLFLGGSGEGASKLEGFVFGANRLLDKYGRNYRPGEAMIVEGDQSEEAFFLYSGSAAAYKNANGGERRLATLNEGQLFGEMAYLLKERRTATVRAETEVVALVLPPAMLEQLMRHSAPLSRRIISTLCQRLEKMNQSAQA